MNAFLSRNVLRRCPLLSALVLVSALLISCESANDVMISTTGDGAAEVDLTPPEFIAQARAVDPDSLVLEVTINGSAAELTRNAAGQYVGIVMVPSNSNVEIRVRWLQRDSGQTDLDLAVAETTLLVSASQSTAAIDFGDEDYNRSFDYDQDGVSNLAELNAATNPRVFDDPVDPVVEVTLNLRFAMPEILQGVDDETRESVFAVAQVNERNVALSRNGEVWIGTALVAQGSDAFVEATFYDSAERSVRLAQVRRNEAVGDGGLVLFSADSYESAFDDDTDGLNNIAEITGGSNPLDSNSPPQDPCEVSQFNAGCTIDSDDDGLFDSVETVALDRDDDGIPDYLESNTMDSDKDTLTANVDRDDTDACNPSINNPTCAALLKDTDEDGKTDIQEGNKDTDSDGKLDRDESSIVDTDKDGTFDEFDADDKNVCVPATDNEACQDLIRDTDNDGETDMNEGSGDTDKDGKPDFQESNLLDADNDGLNDEQDRFDDDPCKPSESNAACEEIRRDTDDDGKTDIQEGSVDTDKDGKLDRVESALLDADNDNTVDELDPDDEDVCKPSLENEPCQDLIRDTDKDGKTDIQEGDTDTDEDGKLDYLESAIRDADGDNLVDELDPVDNDPCEPDDKNLVCEEADGAKSTTSGGLITDSSSG